MLREITATDEASPRQGGKLLSHLRRPRLSGTPGRFESSAILRRCGWLTENTSVAKLTAIARSSIAFALRSEIVSAYPSVVKIDISPLCGLHCKMCS